MLPWSTSLILLVSVVTRGDSIPNEIGQDTEEDIINKNNNVDFQDGLVRFEDSLLQSNRGPQGFQDGPRQPVRFSEDIPDHNSNYDLNQYKKVVFQDDNYIGNFQSQTVEDHNEKGHKKKKRRRRRKPRLQNFAGQQSMIPIYPGQQYPGPHGQQYPGPHGQQYPGPHYSVPPGVYGYPGVSPPFRRPQARPTPVVPDAITSTVAALTSIARYDDHQCVPRLLCEASGNGALNNVGSTSIVQSILRLQPLLTVLSAYNGLSSSPIYVFGRAVFLGMTSKDTSACPEAYPLCPRDPERLVHYLNNHNGGFFRFFNAPNYGQQQNLEQFYNQLLSSGSTQNGQQNYGLYQPHGNTQGFDGQNNGGIAHNGPHVNLQQAGQNYGISGNYGYPNGYGFQYPYTGPTGYGTYNPTAQNYRSNNNSIKMNTDIIKDESNTKIQRRVLTKTDSNNDAIEDSYLELSSPEYSKNGFRFPEEDIKNNNDILNYDRKSRTIQFPGAQANRNDYTKTNDQSKLTYNDYYNGFRFVDDVKIHNDDENLKDDDFEIVYVVRGNGDPNYPEAVKIKAGTKYY